MLKIRFCVKVKQLVLCSSTVIVELLTLSLFVGQLSCNGLKHTQCVTLEMVLVYRMGQKTGPQTHDHNSVKS